MCRQRRVRSWKDRKHEESNHVLRQGGRPAHQERRGREEGRQEGSYLILSYQAIENTVFPATRSYRKENKSPTLELFFEYFGGIYISAEKIFYFKMEKKLPFKRILDQFWHLKWFVF